MNLAELNQNFSIEDQLRFVEGAGGFVYAEIETPTAKARVSCYAGQILSWQPKAAAHDLFFVSPAAFFAPGKAIKGGAPICWPWFGNDPNGRGAHGFVRNRPWRVSKTQVLDTGAISLCLAFDLNAQTQAIWPEEAELSLTFEIGAELSLALETRNLGTKTLPITQGLHSYFKVGDIHQVQVLGLDGHSYEDKVGEPAERTQQGPIEFRGEVNRIYLNVDKPLMIQDASLKRRIQIEASGSKSAVVWNPWAATAKAMDDLLDDDYLRMVCVETTNAGPDVVAIAPGASHSLKATYRILDL